MGGDDFNKTDDDEDNSNYEIDINVIIEQSIKEHDKNIDQQKSINREWRDSFVEAIWRKIKNKVNNEITRIIKQELYGRDYARYNKNIERSVRIDIPTEVFFRHPPLVDRRIEMYYTVKNNQPHMFLEYFFENGLPAGTASKSSISVDAISGEELQDSFCSHVKGKIAGCKSVNLTHYKVKRKINFGMHEEEYTQYKMKIVW